MSDTPPPSWYEVPEPADEPEDERGGHACGRCGVGITDDTELCFRCEERLEEARHEAREMMADHHGPDVW